MQLETEIETLQLKIDEQQKTLDNLEDEESRLQAYIVEFKDSIKKKSIANASKTTHDDSQKTAKQLQKQLLNVQTAYKNCQNQLKTLERRQSHIKANDLTEIEYDLREKQVMAKSLKQSIKQLQSNKRKQQKLHKRKVVNDDGAKLTKIIEQIRKNKEILDTYTDRRKTKKDIIQKKMETLSQLQNKYYDACKNNNETPLTYEQFKEKKRQKKREQMSELRSKYSSVSKKSHQSVRDIIHSQFINEKSLQYTEKTIKELMVKKDIAESALKNAYKKYDREIEEAEEKIESLNKEHESLNTRLLEKKKQKQMIENNVSDYSTKMYNTSKTTRKLTPLK